METAIDNPRMKSFVGTVRQLTEEERIAQECEARELYRMDVATYEHIIADRDEAIADRNREITNLKAELQALQDEIKLLKEQFKNS